MTPSQPMLLNCPACGAPLDYDGSSSVIRCKFCGNRSLVEGGSSNPAAHSGNVDQIRQMVASGNLQDALDQVQSLFGVDLENANDALEAIKEGHFATRFVSSQHSPAELTQTLQKIQSLLADGNKVEAIKVYREVFDTSLTRAKQAIDLIENGQGLQVDTSYTSYQTQTPPTPYGSSTNKKGCGTAALVSTLVILVAIAAGILFAWKGGLFIPHYYAQSPEILVPAGADANPQIASLFYDSSADTRFVGLLNPETKRLLWQAAPLKSDNYLSKLINGSDLIYAASEDNLLAYKKTDGSLAWQTVMPDALNYAGNTLLATSGRVITFNADKSIQAYNAETGSLVWSKRLAGYSDTMLQLDKSLLVVDYANDDHNYGLYFLDPVTGAQQELITPTCTVNDYENSFDTDTAMHYDAAENTLYFVFYEGCIEKMDLATHTIAWTTINPEYFSSSLNGYDTLNSDTHFYFSNGGNLYDITKSNGTLSTLSQNEDYNLYPLEISGDVLLVRADRTRGTSRSELWGLSLNNGSQIWQKTLEDAEPIDPPNEMSGFIDDTDFGWTLKQTTNALVLITFKGEPNQLVLDTLDASDGRITSSQTIAIKGIMGDFYDIPFVLGWQNTVVYLAVDSSFYKLDTATGELVNLY